MILDQLHLKVKAGNGGHGAVSFRREKFVSKGGPDGGDGGKGGDIIIKADNNLYTFLDMPHTKFYRAGNGAPGMGKNKHGKDGEDVLIKVPCGTIIKDANTGEILADLVENGSTYIVAKGGKGGQGNKHFATPINRTPYYAQKGIEGEYKEIVLELKMIADVGLVGYPNAGKSTLLSVMSNAHPEIADYPFTTLTPNLGIVKVGDFGSYAVADIPGIIEGAHNGKGLGLEFLRHIERTKILLFLIDITEENPKEIYEKLINELKEYDSKILEKHHLLAFSKIDLLNDKKINPNIFKNYIPEKIFYISSVANINIDQLKNELYKYVIKERNELG